MELNILTPNRTLLQNYKVKSVCLPGSEGEIEILEGHAHMMGTLEAGRFAYRPEEDVTKATEGVITTGFFEVKGESVYVMAENLELQTEIDVSRAKEAQKKAEEALNDASLAPEKFNKYQLKLRRALIRQQVASRK